jgi:transglycosylase-like protein with SLT domain
MVERTGWGRGLGRAAAGVLAATAALLLLLAGPAPAAAAQVGFPLTVEYDLLRTALRKHLREQSGGQLVIWRSADGCREFVMHEPRIEPVQGNLRIFGPASAQVGLGMLGYCWAQIDWDGRVDIIVRPEIAPDWQLRLGIVDTQLLDTNGQPSGVASRVWDTVKVWAEGALPTFAYDLGPPVQEVRGALGLFTGPATAAGPAGASRLAAALATMRPVGLSVEPDGLRVSVAIDLPTGPVAPRAPEPALTPAQVKQWEAALDRWDGFLTFVVKDLAGSPGDAELRTELLDVLLTARHDLLAVLGRGPEPGVDPVQRLFVSVWSRLRGPVRRAAAQAGDEARTLRYLTFLASGDALTALTAAAPALGLEITADGLRRLAREVDPTVAGDPLQIADGPDSGLRRIFRFRDPDAPPRRKGRKPPTSWDWLGPRVAHAADLDDWIQLNRRLDRWVPRANETATYRDTVDRLLTLAAERTFDPAEVSERFETLFQNVVKTTAWQESCWRQFVVKGGVVTYVLSPTNDVGMMQINVRVWRGFFDAERLRWSAAYNVGAGAEILYQLLSRYGVREASNRLDNAARSVYSAYNGGPARFQRYRLARAPDWARRIDRAFWEKYQLVATGAARDRVLCLAT